MKLRPDQTTIGFHTKLTVPRETYQPDRAVKTQDPEDKRVKLSKGAGASTADGAGGPASSQLAAIPKVLSANAPEGKADLLPLPPMLDTSATHTENFLSLSSGSTRRAWSQVWTHTPDYDQDQVDLPFPFPADERGLMENNLMGVTVHGLRAMGADAEARGLLENWLDLGERYTAIPGSNQLAELGRAGPPRLSALLLEEFDQHADPEFLRRSYKVVKDDYQHSWCDTYFKQTSNGLNRYCDVDYSNDATLDESGGAHNHHRFGGDPQPFNAVDLNSYLYRTEKDLAKMSRQLGLPSEGWEEKAATRKKKMLETLWDPQKGTFLDYNFRTGQRSQVQSLAALSVLEAGLLDPEVPAEAEMARKVASQVGSFLKPDGVHWDSESDTLAPNRELLGLSEGLNRYGFKEEASQLKEAVKARIGDTEPEATTEDLAVRALLGQPLAEKKERGLDAWMSPTGMGRLRRLSGAVGQAKPRVALREAGALDRRLRRLHPSMLELPVLDELRGRDLVGSVIGLVVKNGELAVDEPEMEFKPTSQTMTLGGLKLDFEVEGLKAAKLDESAVMLEKGGQRLPVVVGKEHLILGDRAYPLGQFKKGAKLPSDIFKAFHAAGGNPGLEEFYHANRDWVSGGLGPHCSVGASGKRQGWKKLYDLTHQNWSGLTIEPSVVDHDTAVQYFNRAAVPSVGIFKTQFNWDTMFMAKGMQLQGQEKLISEMTDNLLYLLKSTGRVPNAARSVYLNKSQPPFLPSLVRMSEPIRNREHGTEATREWVKASYDLMSQDYHQFWREEGARGVHQIGDRKVTLSRWGGANHKFAMDESGFDTASRFYGKTKDLIPPDLNAFLWGYASDMEAISLRLRDQAQADGNTQEYLKLSTEASNWGAEAKRIKQDVIDFCWDEEDGMFRDYRFQGEPAGLQRDEDALSACVAPLWVGMLDPSDPKEKVMIERSLENISRFEKDNGLAATAEDYGHPEMQWNGPSGWAPLTMMAVESQVRYGRHDAAARHTQKWLDTIDKVHSRDGMILERYDVVKGDHPPVQKGRYEETQGEGPGFGWTNATVPWAMVEVFGGVRLHRDPALPTRMDVIPNLPDGLQGEPYKMTFADPGSGESYDLEHRYEPEAGNYDFQMKGTFGEIPTVCLVTPPLPPGMVPKAKTEVPYTVKPQKAENGQVRYRLTFEKLQGEQTISMGFGEPQPTA